MDDIDLETYGEPNDLAPDVPAPREPQGEPNVRTDDYHIWTFESDRSAVVPDTYVVARDPSPLDFRMWIFSGEGETARFVVRSSHRYGPDAGDDRDEGECCEVLIDGASLTEDHCPQDVVDLVTDIVEKPITYPESEDSAGPIQY
jgi:hypothetical protein